jgi:Fe-Mn family superoxide dismutase
MLAVHRAASRCASGVHGGCYGVAFRLGDDKNRGENHGTNRDKHTHTRTLTGGNPMTIDRRVFLAATGFALAGRAAFAQAPAAPPAAAPPAPPAFTLPPLGYAYDALEPFIDTATMRVHHSGHHQAFISNLNTIAGQWEALRTTPVEQVLANLADVPDAVRTGVRNNLGGHWNHDFFWKNMAPGGAKAPTGPLADAIAASFGSTLGMVNAFTQQAMTRFGSGWAWLVVDKDKKLAVMNTPYQDTPLEVGARAVIGCDVWEHAYYLKHQNRRANYVRDWWNTVNWTVAQDNFRKAMS